MKTRKQFNENIKIIKKNQKSNLKSKTLVDLDSKKQKYEHSVTFKK